MKRFSVCFIFIFILSFLLFQSNLYAAHPLITDDAYTVGRGKGEIEFTFEYSSYKESEINLKTYDIGATLTYGILENLDLILTLPYQQYRLKAEGETFKEKGISDVSVELKWQFYEKKEVCSLALKPVLTLPTGDEEKGLGSGRATYGLYFIASKEIEPLIIHFNLGYVRNENKFDERKDIWHVSVASEIEIIKDLVLVGNIAVERNPDRGSNTNPAFILGGLIYSLAENLSIDLGIKAGLNKAEVDYAILAGLTYKF
ncbi:MAG: transporter [Thermodesulfovibrionales bacterium]|nr:transporter [Thermodesulfovibrionales bacterium]